MCHIPNGLWRKKHKFKSTADRTMKPVKVSLVGDVLRQIESFTY